VGEWSGAIFVSYGSSATIRDSLFDGNDGSVANDEHSAGAISTFGGGEGAQVVNSNGVRDVGGDAFLDISGTTFKNNKGTFGAVYTLLSGLKVEDSVFTNNEGLDGSGAIFTDGANGTEKPDNLGGTTIIRNVVAEDNVGGGDYGGAFFLYGYSKDKYILENNTISNNKAGRGAGITVQSARDEGEGNGVELIIRDSIIDDNIASSQGGGLWTDVKGGVSIEDSTFSGNRVENSNATKIGGAIVLNYKTDAKSTITDTTFTENYAGSQAGNIWIAGNKQAQNLTISDSRFADNRSGNSKKENTVNFTVTDGGGNIVQNTNGADTGIPGATFVDDLQLSPIPQSAGNSIITQSEPPVNTENPTNQEPEITLTEENPIENVENIIINGIVDLSNVDFDGDGTTDEKVSLVLDDINHESTNLNWGGFYQILDSDGSVVDPLTNQVIQPGEEGYSTVALNQRITELEFYEEDGSLSTEVDGGIIIAPYLISNGTVEEFLDKNPNNDQQTGRLNAYFGFADANPDGLNHLESKDNSFGFEDLYGGGDLDFNDLTFRVNVESL